MNLDSINREINSYLSKKIFWTGFKPCQMSTEFSSQIGWGPNMSYVQFGLSYEELEKSVPFELSCRITGIWKMNFSAEGA